MRLARRIGRFSWKGIHGLFHCSHILLAFTAVLLTLLILFNSVQREVPLPDGFVHFALSKLTGSDYRSKWDRAVFDLRGGLYLENYQVDNRQSGDKILAARALRIDLALVNLAFGQSPPVSELTAHGLELFVPAYLSPSGVNEPLLDIAHLQAGVENNRFELGSLLLQWRGVRLAVEGTAPLEAFRAEGTGPGPAGTYASLVHFLREAAPWDLDVEARVGWTMKRSGDHLLEIVALSPSLRPPLGNLRKTRLQASLAIQGSQPVVTHLGLRGTLHSLHPDSPVNPPAPFSLALPVRFSLEARGLPVLAGTFRIPSSLSMILHEPVAGPFPVRSAILETSLVDQNPALKATLYGPDIDLRASIGSFFPNLVFRKAGSPAPPFSLDLRLHNPRLQSLFPRLPDHRLLENAGCRFLRASVTHSPTPGTFSGTLLTDRLHIGQTDFAHLRSAFSFDSGQLRFPRIHVSRSASESASGSYFHNLDSTHFSLNARGAIFPDALDRILGSWWEGIFTHIEADKPVPGDVTVWGSWREESGIQSYTRAHGTDVRYRGLPVPEVEVRVRSNRDWVLLEKLEADFGKYQIEGMIGWRQGLAATEPRPVVVDFGGKAPWEVVQTATAIAALEDLHVGGEPEIEASGVIWRPSEALEESGNTGEVYPDLDFELVHRSGTCRLGSLDMGSLNFEGRIRGRDLALPNISGTFAEGVFTGNARITAWGIEDRETRDLDLQIFDADYRSLLYQLTELMEDPSGLRNSLLRDAEGGRMDAELRLHLPPSLENATGGGRITIRQARIGQIHLFGGLSRALNGMGFGFSSIDLNTGFIVWQLSDGIASVPEVLLTGPVLSLDAAGEIDLLTRRLNLTADVTLFRGLISKVLTPVSETAKFDLSGPFEAPVWGVRLDPIRWLRNRMPDTP